MLALFIILGVILVAFLATGYLLLNAIVKSNPTAFDKPPKKPLYKLNGRRIELQFDGLSEHLADNPITGLGLGTDIPKQK